MKNRRIRFGGPRQQRTTATIDQPLDISTLTLDGRGFGHFQGKAVFVRDSLPGEQVRVEVEKSSKRFDEAFAVELITQSPDRITPVCQYYSICGGCDLQHLDPIKAVDFKQQALLSQLSKRANLVPETVDPAIMGGQFLAYRRSARIGINQRDTGEVLIGFRRRASNKLVDIDHCPVLQPSINAFLVDLRAMLTRADRIKHITQAEVIAGDFGLEVDLRATRNLAPELQHALTELAIKHNANLSISVKDSSTLTVHSVPQAKKFTIDDSLIIEFSARDFVQVNAEVNRLMINRVLDWFAPKSTDLVLDLFSGLGNFSLPLARRVHKLVAVEGSEQMVSRCLENAHHNGINNIEAYAANLSVPDLKANWLSDNYDLILLDPPRLGAADIIAALSSQSPRAIVYIACDPSSLVRDAATLSEMGYMLSRLCVADMFAQTHHIESLALFERM